MTCKPSSVTLCLPPLCANATGTREGKGKSAGQKEKPRSKASSASAASGDAPDGAGQGNGEVPVSRLACPHHKKGSSRCCRGRGHGIDAGWRQEAA